MASRKALIANLRLDPATKPIRATIKLQNNCLRARRMALGLSTHEIADRVGLSYNTYLRMEGMKQSPLSSVKDGQGWKESAQKLARFYRVLPENLFPSVVLAVDQPVTSREFDESEIQALLPDYMRRESLGPEEIMTQNQLRGTVTRTLRQLKPIQAEVVKRYYGLDTGTNQGFGEIAQEIGMSRERIRQIHDCAIGKLHKVVSDETILPALAPNELGWGTRCVLHNLGRIKATLDPVFPLIMKVQLSMPDPSSGGPPFEVLQFQGKTAWTLMKAADSCLLSTHPRLMTIDITNHERVLRHKEGPKGDWTVPSKTEVVTPIAEEPPRQVSPDCSSLNIPLCDTPITTRLLSGLNHQGIGYLGELALMDAEQVFLIYNLGSKSVAEAKNLLRAHGLWFGSKIPGWVPPTVMIVIESDWTIKTESGYSIHKHVEVSSGSISFQEILAQAFGGDTNSSSFEIMYRRLGASSPEGHLRYDPPERVGETESVSLSRLMEFRISRRKEVATG